MDEPLLGLLAAILFPLGMIALRALTRERQPVVEPTGVSVFEGDAEACQQRIDLLANAGITAWMEGDPDQGSVLVDAAQAPDIPTLLAAPVEHDLPPDDAAQLPLDESLRSPSGL